MNRSYSRGNSGNPVMVGYGIRMRVGGVIVTIGIILDIAVIVTIKNIRYILCFMYRIIKFYIQNFVFFCY